MSFLELKSQFALTGFPTAHEMQPLPLCFPTGYNMDPHHLSLSEGTQLSGKSLFPHLVV